MSGSLVLRSGVGTQMLIVSSSADDREVGRRVEPAGGAELLARRLRHVGDVRAPGDDRVDLARVEVDAGRVEPVAGEFDGQRQPDVAEADDAGPCGA